MTGQKSSAGLEKKDQSKHSERTSKIPISDVSSAEHYWFPAKTWTSTVMPAAPLAVCSECYRQCLGLHWGSNISVELQIVLFHRTNCSKNISYHISQVTCQFCDSDKESQRVSLLTQRARQDLHNKWSWASECKAKIVFFTSFPFTGE